jgi:hypothetical protein
MKTSQVTVILIYLDKWAKLEKRKFPNCHKAELSVITSPDMALLPGASRYPSGTGTGGGGGSGGKPGGVGGGGGCHHLQPVI